MDNPRNTSFIDMIANLQRQIDSLTIMAQMATGIGYSAGGGGGITAVVDDTTPQLGGNLDVNGHLINGTDVGVNASAVDGTLDLTASSGKVQIESGAGYGISIGADGSITTPDTNGSGKGNLRLESNGEIYLSPGVSPAGYTRIYNGKLTSDLDADSKGITNLPMSPSVVTGSRALDDGTNTYVYHNTSGKPRVVVGTFAVSGTLGNGLNSVIGYLGATSSPSTSIGEWKTRAMDNVSGSLNFSLNSSGWSKGSLVMLIPPGYYYKFNASLGSPTLAYWVEYDLF